MPGMPSAERMVLRERAEAVQRRDDGNARALGEARAARAVAPDWMIAVADEDQRTLRLREQLDRRAHRRRIDRRATRWST